VRHKSENYQEGNIFSISFRIFWKWKLSKPKSDWKYKKFSLESRKFSLKSRKFSLRLWINFPLSFRIQTLNLKWKFSKPKPKSDVRLKSENYQEGNIFFFNKFSYFFESENFQNLKVIESIKNFHSKVENFHSKVENFH
jgi:hypothetical protein